MSALAAPWMGSEPLAANVMVFVAEQAPEFIDHQEPRTARERARRRQRYVRAAVIVI